MNGTKDIVLDRVEAGQAEYSKMRHRLTVFESIYSLLSWRAGLGKVTCARRGSRFRRRCSRLSLVHSTGDPCPSWW